MRVALPIIKHAGIKPKLVQQTKPFANKINLNHLSQLTHVQNSGNIKCISTNNVFRTFPGNTTQKQWRLVAISETKTSIRKFRLPYDKEYGEEKDAKRSKILDNFGPASEPSLPKDVPILVYGFMNSFLVPMLFVILGSMILLYAANNQYWNERAFNQWHLFKRWLRSNYNYGIGHWFIELPDHVKVYLPLFVANLAVFASWQVTKEKVQEFLFYNFMHSTVHKNPIGMLLSGFSHKSVMHFAFNMIALFSFCGTASVELGNSQMMAIFLAGCLVSSGTSHLFKLATRDIAPSLGASGGVFALVAATTYLNPDMPLNFIFLPFVTFTAIKLLPVLVGFDCLGAALRITGRRWIGLDHAAHLGGAAFGWFYTDWVMKNMSSSIRKEMARRKEEKELAEKRKMFGMQPKKSKLVD